MYNEIIRIDNKSIESLKNKTGYIVEINGSEINNISSYFNEISHKMDFPMLVKGYDGYNDWMRDLSWINSDEIIIIINHYKDFLKDDDVAKSNIDELFRNSILPWWEEEVYKYSVCGKKKKFIVYYVD